MTCAEVLDRLDEYVDGDLDEAPFQEVELHLHGCAACREEERALRALLAEAGAMPREVAPPRDLWAGIAGRIEGRRKLVALLPRRRALWAGLAAAAALVLAVSASWGTRSLRRDEPPSPPRVATAGRPVGTLLTAAAGPALEQAEREYTRATGELMAALDARRATLSPDTLAVVEENLRIIDRALGQLRDALGKDPANPHLARMLRATHQRKIQVLQRVVGITT